MAELDRLRADAVAALGEVLRDPGAKPADRLRAAEAILRADRDGLAPTGDAYELADQALLAIAREGGTPPERGPAESRAAAVPSHAVGDLPPISLPALPPGLVLPANPFLQRGPKEDPSQRAPRGVPSAMGPKEDPDQEGDPDPWT